MAGQARATKPALGTVRCDCGDTATLHQAARIGGHLFKRCPSCGMDQRTGTRIQEQWWFTASWFDGPPPHPPVCIKGPVPLVWQPQDGENRGAKTAPAVIDAEPVVIERTTEPAPIPGDFDTSAIPDEEPPVVTEPRPNRGGWGALAVFCLAAVGGGVWATMTRR